MLQVVKNEYTQQHNCITLQELRWIMHHLERHSPYYTYLLLRATTGIRGGELIENVTTKHIIDDGRTIAYRIMKPRHRSTRDGARLTINKHRTVHLDAWVRGELLAYLNRYGRQIGGEYVTAWQGQHLFPWRRNAVAVACWYKLRAKLRDAGFAADRVVAEWLRDNGTMQYKPVYVLRPHILRHFYASVMYVKYGYDLKRVQEDIQHEHIETTSQYVHSPPQLGTTEEFLRSSSWAEILGFDEQQTTLPGHDPVQRVLDMF